MEKAYKEAIEIYLKNHPECKSVNLKNDPKKVLDEMSQLIKNKNKAPPSQVQPAPILLNPMINHMPQMIVPNPNNFRIVNQGMDIPHQYRLVTIRAPMRIEHANNNANNNVINNNAININEAKSMILPMYNNMATANPLSSTMNQIDPNYSEEDQYLKEIEDDLDEFISCIIEIDEWDNAP